MGKDHPDYLDTLGAVAQGLKSAGKHGEAYDCYDECRAIQLRTVGKEHPDYAATLSSMGRCLHA